MSTFTIPGVQQRFTGGARAPQLSKRADGKQVLAGYAAVFYRADDPGTQYDLWEGFVERIAVGCFDRALREKQDVRALFNHSMDQLLGRSRAGTLRLSVDAVGLHYEIDLADTQCARDLAVSIERGDITGSSFSFWPKKTQYVEEPDLTTRILQDVDLVDVGPVTFPAYESTTAGLRSSDGLAGERAEYDQWRRQRDAESVLVRLRLMDLERS